MLLEHFSEIHPIELIATEDDVILVGDGEEVGEVLPDGVGGALIPALIRGRLLRREQLDEAPGKLVKLVSGLNVPVEGDAVVLREHVNATEAGVEAIGNWDVHEPIF